MVCETGRFTTTTITNIRHGIIRFASTLDGLLNGNFLPAGAPDNHAAHAGAAQGGSLSSISPTAGGLKGDLQYLAAHTLFVQRNVRARQRAVARNIGTQYMFRPTGMELPPLFQRDAGIFLPAANRLLGAVFVYASVQRQHQRLRAKTFKPALSPRQDFTAVEPMTTTRATPAFVMPQRLLRYARRRRPEQARSRP